MMADAGYPDAAADVAAMEEQTKKFEEISQKLMAAQQTGQKPGNKDMELIKQLLAQAQLGRNTHKFWGSQPVPQNASELTGDDYSSAGPIDTNEDVKLVKKDPYPLPAGFEWAALEIDNDEGLGEMYTLLYENYVEDDDAQFRFDYSKDFLKWALRPKDGHPEWLIGVRVSKSKKLVGMITGIPQRMRIHDKERDMCEINFLCVHKKLRSKRLAPVLIKEVTRRVNLKGIWQAVYTAGVNIPTPMAECRYFHRSINPKKLIEVGFSPLAPRMTIARTVKLYKLPDETNIKGFRPMKAEDVNQVTKLVNNYLKKFKMAPVLKKSEVEHWLLPISKRNMFAYVVENNNKITDVCSFYSLPSSVLKHSTHKTLWAAYSFWNVATSVPFKDLMNNLLIKSRDEGFDVFNALNLMENGDILQDLKFARGEGNLHFYLFNYKTPMIEHQDVGLVLF